MKGFNMKLVTKIVFLAGCLLIISGIARAQGARDMRINELLSVNTDNFEDDYGYKHGWIELFNNSYGTLNIGGCYLSDDRNDLKKYIIPKGDVLTIIPPRQNTLFWADNEPYRGTFHISFKLNENGGNVFFTSSDGRTIIDSVSYPALEANVSYGRVEDGSGAWKILERSTPSSNNKLLDSSKSAHFLEVDPFGFIMTVTAMAVVFSALVLLYFVFRQIGKYSIKSEAKKSAEVTGRAADPNPEEISGEVYAAIVTAMELYMMQEEVHDIENTILTITKVARAYSPWSSRIYGLREIPVKK